MQELNNKEQAKELLKIVKEIYNTKIKNNEFWLEGLEDSFENFDKTFENTILKYFYGLDLKFLLFPLF